MSFDLVVFDAQYLPKPASVLVSWVQNISGSYEDFRFPDDCECTGLLRKFFSEIKFYFPWREEQDVEACDATTEYEFAKHMIRCCFSWPEESKATDTVLALCWRLKLGVYFITGSGDVVYPEEVWDVINAKKQTRRPWWKIWRP